MTTQIIINTGILGAPADYNFDKRDILLNTAADLAGEGASPEAIDAHLAALILQDITAPKRAATVRGHLCSVWPLIAPMAARSPDLFDRILSEAVAKLTEAD